MTIFGPNSKYYNVLSGKLSNRGLSTLYINVILIVVYNINVEMLRHIQEI